MAVTSIGNARAEHGTGALLQIFRDGRSRTRSELVEMTGYARSTVSTRVDDLLRVGLLTTAGDAPSSGGRPPAKLKLNVSALTILSIDLGASHGTVALVDIEGTVKASTTKALDINAGPERVLDDILDTADELIAGEGDVDRISGVGIGVPGPVEHSTGRPVRPPIMAGWDGFDIPEYIRKRFQVPILVDNDVNLLALGEYRSAWHDVDDLLFIKASTGIGAGIISSGQLRRGAQGTAGDIGHIQVPSGTGVPCTCGNVDCLEALASTTALAKQLNFDVPRTEASKELARRARAADTETIAAIRQAGRHIGEVVASTVNILNPSVIVLGGSMAAASEHLLAGIIEVVYRRSAPLATQDLRIVTARTGAAAGVVGAAHLVVDHLLSPQMIDRLLRKNDRVG